MSADGHNAEIDSSVLLCAFALGRGLYCTRRAGHQAADGWVTRHDSTANEHIIPPAKPGSDS